MLPSSIRSLVLTKLEEGLPGLNKTWGKFLAEASAVCFECSRHPKGVQLAVKGIKPTVFEVQWNIEISEQDIRSWDNDHDMAEYGACGIAVLLILELTEYTVIRRARTGDGVDYWLGSKDSPLPFQDAARLEVSGMLTGNDSKERTRIQQKKKQTEPSDGSLPAYVVVVNFQRPVSHLVQK
ncbi:MAG: hypothetical protein OHK0022_21040 [Roseiflexaceae bacterium]